MARMGDDAGEALLASLRLLQSNGPSTNPKRKLPRSV